MYLIIIDLFSVQYAKGFEKPVPVNCKMQRFFSSFGN